MSAPRTSQRPRPSTRFAITLVLASLLGAAAAGCASTDPEQPPAPPAATEPAPTVEERWGVEVVALRLTGAGYMLDFRYKVLDPDKAAELFERANKPALIHRASGSKLEVPRPAKTGPLRPTNPPQAGRVYFMLFSNPGIVKAGDEVTVTIGDFEVDVVVE
jgi:hypothetical protein